MRGLVQVVSIFPCEPPREATEASTVHTSPFKSESGQESTSGHENTITKKMWAKCPKPPEDAEHVSTVEPAIAEKSTRTSLHDTGTSITVQLRLHRDDQRKTGTGHCMISGTSTAKHQPRPCVVLKCRLGLAVAPGPASAPKAGATGSRTQRC